MRGVDQLSIAALIKGIVFYKYIFPMWFMFQLLVYIALASVVFKVLENTKLSFDWFLYFDRHYCFIGNDYLSFCIEDINKIF